MLPRIETSPERQEEMKVPASPDSRKRGFGRMHHGEQDIEVQSSSSAESKIPVNQPFLSPAPWGGESRRHSSASVAGRERDVIPAAVRAARSLSDSMSAENRSVDSGSVGHFTDFDATTSSDEEDDYDPQGRVSLSQSSASTTAFSVPSVAGPAVPPEPLPPRKRRCAVAPGSEAFLDAVQIGFGLL